jgi:signal transduction histidine kinase
LGSAARDRELLAVLGDRDRIARDLHDLVIQRLFATGMQLEGATRRMSPPDSVEKVRSAVEELDRTIKEIRTTIFALQAPAPAAGEGLRTAVLQAVRSASTPLGFEPTVHFEGPVDTLVPAGTAEQLLAVLRESLSNAARHAEASAVEVAVAVDGGQVKLRVSDNGRGLNPDGRRSGLRNLAERAAALGGQFSAERAEDGAIGTVVQWAVPLPS